MWFYLSVSHKFVTHFGFLNMFLKSWKCLWNLKWNNYEPDVAFLSCSRIFLVLFCIHLTYFWRLDIINLAMHLYFGNASRLLCWNCNRNQVVMESVLSCFSSGYFNMITPLAKDCLKHPALVRAEAIINTLINPHCAPVLTRYVTEAPD